jgi:replicative DNA helicase
MILNPDIIDSIRPRLKVDDLYHGKHRIIYQHILRVHDEAGTIDLPMICDSLDAAKKSEVVGGASYVEDLIGGITSANAERYLSSIRGRAALRNVLSACQVATEEIFAGNGAPPKDLLDQVSGPVFDAFQAATQSGHHSFTMADIVKDIMETADRALSGEVIPVGLSTGYSDIDRIIGGLRPGKLIIIAGRPSMGKTTFLLNLLREIAGMQRKRCLFFSMESTARDMAQNIIAAHAGINNMVFQGWIMSEEDRERMTHGAAWLEGSPLIIDEDASLTVHDIRAKTRALHGKKAIDLVAVDYLQLVRSTGSKRAERRDLEVADITARLKALAKEIGAPVIALAQLNRAVEARVGNRPRLSDLRESGSLEQDADIVMFMHRPGYYSQDEGGKSSRVAEVIIEKHRDGPRGTAHMTYVFEHSRFRPGEARWARGISENHEEAR